MKSTLKLPPGKAEEAGDSGEKGATANRDREVIPGCGKDLDAQGQEEEVVGHQVLRGGALRMALESDLWRRCGPQGRDWIDCQGGKVTESDLNVHPRPLLFQE